MLCASILWILLYTYYYTFLILSYNLSIFWPRLPICSVPVRLQVWTVAFRLQKLVSISSKLYVDSTRNLFSKQASQYLPCVPSSELAFCLRNCVVLFVWLLSGMAVPVSPILTARLFQWGIEQLENPVLGLGYSSSRLLPVGILARLKPLVVNNIRQIGIVSDSSSLFALAIRSGGPSCSNELR